MKSDLHKAQEFVEAKELVENTEFAESVRITDHFVGGRALHSSELWLLRLDCSRGSLLS